MPLLGGSFDEDANEIFGTIPHTEQHETEEEEIVEQSKPQESPGECQDQEKGASSQTSVFRDISLFRDFFLSAFSDGYQNDYCCGDFPNCCTVPGTRRVAPDEKGGALPLTQGAPYPVLQSSQTYEDRGRIQRRKRPLALAVGYNYAADANGRPVVITPGSRRSPIDLTNMHSSRSASATLSATAAAGPSICPSRRQGRTASPAQSPKRSFATDVQRTRPMFNLSF